MKNFVNKETPISELPIFEEKNEKVKQQSPIYQINSSFKKKLICDKILIVDDDPYYLLVLEIILKSFGYKCVKAMNGQEAINKLKINSCKDNETWELKLIFMDYLMPVMNGAEAAKEILKLKNIPIIGCTVFTNNEIITKCLDAGMKDVISNQFLKKLLGIFCRNG